MFDFLSSAKHLLERLAKKYIEALYVTKNQYRIRFVNYKLSKQGKAWAIIQVAIKRSKIKLPLDDLASNKEMLCELHPVDAARVAFLSCLNKEGLLNKVPGYINSKHSCPIIRENPTLKIRTQQFNHNTQQTTLTLKGIKSNFATDISAIELLRNHELLYGLDTKQALQVGYAAGEDFVNNKDYIEDYPITSSHNNKELKYYHILCVFYVALSLAGISIVRRMFPFHVPLTHVTVPFGAGVILFPLTFAIQDITTEVYGFAKSRHMVWLSLFMITFYMIYTQLAIHLPSGQASVYKHNPAFSIVFGAIPRQFLSLVVSILTGMLINDFLISRLKVIYGGRYLWARIIFSTMIGEAVLNIVGLVIGFGDIMHFFSQMLPNMALSYGYKLLWNIASVPFIYLITGFLKKQAGLDVYDYDVNYNPMIIR